MSNNGKSQSHWLLWTLATLFIVQAIAGVWPIDYYYSPDMISPASLPEAAGK